MPSKDDRHDEFMELFLENQPRIYGYIRGLLFQKADAEDVMQETASVLWRKFDEFDGGTNFDRWAFRTAFHQVRKFRQKKARESERLEFSDEVIELLAEGAPDVLDHTEETAAALEQCVRKLSTEDRQLLTWRYAAGGTNRSLSKRLEKSESVVSRTLSRIYESLLKCVSLQLKLNS